MSSPSPPKPWERAGSTATSASPLPSMPSSSPPSSVTAGAPSAAIPTASSTSGTPPSLPDKPSALNTVVNRTASNYSTLGANRYGSTPYGGYGSYGNYSAYGSPYSRFGGGYGGMYGGYGGYGGMYGGMGGMYGGGMGMPGDPNNMSLAQSLGQSTQATFQLLEGIVGAFGGFAQMLESTYMATHSSFFAMVSVAEQFGNLRHTLGQVLGIFTVLRWFRNGMARLTGRPPPASSKDLTPAKFAAFNGQLPDGSPAPRPSKKPLFMFLIAVFGLPYLLGKLIRALASSQEEEERRRMMEANPDMFNENGVIDPSKLDFCRVLYDYTPDTPAGAQAVPGVDLEVKKNDLVAVLSKTDPLGNPSEWWRCRARDGRMGYLPSPYLEPIQRRTPAVAQPQKLLTNGPTSRTQTMTTTSDSASRTSSLTLTNSKDAVSNPLINSKPGDIGVESFQKAQFYS